MRILYVLAENLNRTGGGIVHFLAVARGLKRLGHQVVILGPQYGPTVRRPRDLRAIFLPVLMRSPATFLGFQVLAALVYPFIWVLYRPQAVLVRGGLGMFFLLHLVARLLGARVVLEVNGIGWTEMESRGFSRWHVRFARATAWLQCRTAHRLIAVTPAIGDELVRSCRLSPEGVFVIQNGADPDEFDPSRRQAARAALGLGPDTLAIGVVGSFTPWHGLRETVQAMSRLGPEVRSHVTLFLVGHGDYWDAMSKAVAEEKVGDAVRLPGDVGRREVADYLAAFDVGLYINTDVLVARFGNTPLKFWEYLAAGLPVLASDNCNLTPLIREHGLGWVIEDVSPRGIAAAIEEVWRHRRRLAEMGRRNRELLRQRFSWLAVSREVARVLEGQAVGGAREDP